MRYIALLLLGIPTWGAVAFVNATAGSDATGSSLSTIAATAANHTAGNFLIAGVRTGSTGCTGSSVGDTAGNTFTPVGAAETSGGAGSFRLFYARNITGNASNIVSATLSCSDSYVGVSVLQFSGVDTSSPSDTSTHTSFFNSTPGSLSFSTSTANEVLVMGTSVGALSNSFTAGTGYTLPAGSIDASGMMAMEYKIVSSTQSSVTADMTLGSGQNWITYVATFVEGSGGGGGSTNRRRSNSGAF